MTDTYSGGAGGVGGGVLHVVATPIGNLDDMSMRAIQVLSAADIIAAEDTRHSSRLLEHLGIDVRKCTSMHEHNESARIDMLLTALQDGKQIALISDAGTPLISDPGFRLVAAAHAAGIRVSPVPGVCAAVAALSAAGLPCDRFFFEGFLPATAAARRTRLEALGTQRGTLIFYEAPHRIAETLGALVEVLGASRMAALARELTKLHETVRRGTLAELHAFVDQDPNQQRGEIVLLVAGATDTAAGGLDEVTLLRALALELPATRAARVAAQLLGKPRRELYRQLLELGAAADGAE